MTDRLLLLISLGLSLFLICIKAVASFFSGSVALWASTLDSIMDTVSTVINLFFHKASSFPADREHPFGHGKFEAVASLFQGVFILATGLWVLSSSLLSFWHPKEILHEEMGILVITIAIISPLFLVWFLKKNASQYSLILFSEGEHFASDAFLNISVLIGVLSSCFFHTSLIDSLVGIIASLIIVWRAVGLLRLSASVLLDEKLPEEIESDIIAILNRYSTIEGWHDLRTRRSGSEFHADVHLEFHENILLKDAHTIANGLEEQLFSKYPNLHILTHFDIFSPVSCQK